MSSYGSMSPSEEGCENDAAFFCHSWHSGSPMDGGPYWPAANGEGREYDAQESYHDNTHYIGRNYGYEDMQMTGNEPYDYHHGMHHAYPQNNTAVDCDLQLPLYDRPAPPSFVRVVKRRSTANKKERRRTQSINTAFSDLRECIPNVPPDTKLSKAQLPLYSGPAPPSFVRVVKRRSTANKKERRRTQSINTAFSDLRECIPNVPPDTKLSKAQLPLYSGPAPPSFVRVVKRRSTANKKERRRTQSINTAFSDLRECIPNVPPDTKLSKEHRRTACINSAFSDLKGRIPNVPPDTKLSKIKTLRLATSYISYLLKVLETDGEPAGGFRADLHHTPPRRRHHDSAQGGEKRSKGRTGWPQHVWALELKSEQNLQT